MKIQVPFQGKVTKNVMKMGRVIQKEAHYHIAHLSNNSQMTEILFCNTSYNYISVDEMFHTTDCSV